MIDAHCHLDQIDFPEAIAKEAEARSLTVVAVTNLPSHYAMSLAPLKEFRYIRPALGFHPLMVAANPHEMMPFVRMARAADFIGEVGLDFSEQGLPTKNDQVNTFEKILDAIHGRRRFITIHSRGAVDTVLKMVEERKIKPVVFHWFTGTLPQLDRVICAGHYLSVNPAMLRSSSAIRLIEAMPQDRVLTETDAPFARIEGRKTVPWDVVLVMQHLAKLWRQDQRSVEITIEHTYQKLLSKQQ